MDLREVTLKTLPRSNLILQSNVLQTFSYRDSLVAFAVNSPKPIIYNLDHGTMHLFKDDPNATAIPASICFSPSGDLLATGNNDGSVTIWSIKNDFSFLKNIVGLHKSKITAISFTKVNDTLLASDVQGLTTAINISKAGKEEVIIENDKDQVRKILVTGEESNLAVAILLYDSRFVVLDLKKQGKEKLSSSINLGTKTAPIVLLRDTVTGFELFGFYHNTFIRYIFVSPIQYNRMKSVRLFDSKVIKDVHQFNDELLLVVTSNANVLFLNINTLLLSSISGEPLQKNQIVNRKQTPMTQACFNLGLGYCCYDEKLYVILNKCIIEAKFSSWDYRIMIEVANDDYDIAYASLIKAYEKKSYDLIGASAKGAQFAINVKNTGVKVTRKYIEKILDYEDEEKLAKELKFAIENIAKINLLDFLCNALYKLIESKGKIMIFFNILLDTVYNYKSNFLTDKLFTNILDAYKANDQLEECQRKLLKFKMSPEYARENAKIAYQYGLLRLFGKCLIDLGDYITPLTLIWEKNQNFYPNFLEIAFEKADIITQKYLSVWLVTPIPAKGFKRLYDLIILNPEKAFKIITFIFSFCPLQFGPDKDSIITHTSFVDIVFHTLQDNSVSYEKCSKILSVLCPLFANEVAEITPVAFNLSLQWVFLSDGYNSQRIKVLQMIIDKAPNIIPEDKLDQYCLTVGFLPWIQKKYLPIKGYDKIVEAMVVDVEEQDNAFDFIEKYVDDKNEIISAISKNIVALLIINNIKTLNIITKYFNDKLEDFINVLANEKIVFMYLSALYQIEPETDFLLPRYFELICRFDPDNALEFFEGHSTKLNLEESIKTVKKFGNADCLVHMSRMTGDINAAISSIENVLLDFTEAENNDFVCNNETQLSDFPQLKSSLQAIDICVDFLKETKSPKLFRAFAFPLYHSRTKSHNVHKTLVLLYIHFLVQALKFIDSSDLLPVVFKHIEHFNNEEKSMVLSLLLKEIEYKKNITNVVLEMTTEDCLELIQKAFQEKTKGFLSSDNLYCSSCYQEIIKSTTSFVIFPCGHIFHDTTDCCSSLEKCPICYDGNLSGNTIDDEAPAPKLSKRRIQQLMRRLEFSLKKNYGPDSIETLNPSSIFITHNNNMIPEDEITFGEPQVPTTMFTPVINN